MHHGITWRRDIRNLADFTIQSLSEALVFKLIAEL